MVFVRFILLNSLYMQFEPEGILLGLVSFPFDIDGGELYGEVFAKFFQKHRESYLEKFAQKEQKLDKKLYNPTAYRMFGNHGLAIVSLIDDYAFGSRMFNFSHILSHQSKQTKYNCKIVAVTGSSEIFMEDQNNDGYLRRRAEDTFLRDSTDTPDKCYPFLGIIRMKLDHKLLISNGSRLTRLIKNKTEQVKRQLLEEVCGNGGVEHGLETIAVDSYDNDEILVLSFANSIMLLDKYLRKIRRVSCQDLPELNWEGQGIKHVCASCHVSYGYHLDFSFENPDQKYMPWDSDRDKEFFVNCLIETKPGHGKEFCKQLRDMKSCDLSVIGGIPSRTMTGGSIVQVQIPIYKVKTLQELANGKIQADFFHVHVRRIKLTLGAKGKAWDTHRNKHYSKENPGDLIDSETILNIRDKLTELGVSKIVRERMMALFELYNDCGRSKLQSYYFEQMKDVVQNIGNILDDFIQDESESLLEIEQELTEEINAFETAFYNRMNNKMTPNTVLEYGGGIQQFLQAFGYAHKELVRVISPTEASKQYSLITGVSKESSIRTHTELNINHIIYPQLFSVTSWKEASNFSIHIIDDFNLTSSDFKNYKQVMSIIQSFRSFKHLIHDSAAFNREAVSILSMANVDESDTLYPTFRSLVSRELLKYSFHDYLLYHFVFQRDYEMMWKYYLKIFLQTTGVYARRGIVKRTAFVHILLRLFLVALREEDVARKTKINAFLKIIHDRPFDYLLTQLWAECYSKVKDVARSMCMKLQSYNFTDVSEEIVLDVEYQMLCEGDGHAEYLLESLDPTDRLKSKAINCILEARKANISQLCNSIKNYSMDVSLFKSSNLNSPDNVICLLSAFLICVDELDGHGNDGEGIKTVPRISCGKIDEELFRDMLSNSSYILADPTGGFMIPDHEVRKHFFAYSTVLYRTLWDLSYRSVGTNTLS